MNAMIRLFSSALFIAFFFHTTQTAAQPGGNPPQDIRSQLREFSPNEKLKLLEYMRYLGTSLDKEVQQTYEQLKPEKRAQVVQFMELQMRDGSVPLPRTTVRWTRDTVRFGTIDEGALVLDSFQVTNTGTKPYLIKEVKTSCDCTVLRYPEFPVMPGETATLRIEFDSNGKAGKATPGIIVYDNSSPNTRNILYLSGTVTPRKPTGGTKRE